MAGGEGSLAGRPRIGHIRARRRPRIGHIKARVPEGEPHGREGEAGPEEP